MAPVNSLKAPALRPSVHADGSLLRAGGRVLVRASFRGTQVANDRRLEIIQRGSFRFVSLNSQSWLPTNEIKDGWRRLARIEEGAGLFGWPIVDMERVAWVPAEALQTLEAMLNEYTYKLRQGEVAS